MLLEGILIILFLVYIALLFYPDVATKCENYITYSIPQYFDILQVKSDDTDTNSVPFLESNLSNDVNQYDQHPDQYDQTTDTPSYDFSPTLQHYRSIDPDTPQDLINFTSGITNNSDEYIRNSTKNDDEFLNQLESAIPHSYDLQLESFTNPELVALDNALRVEGEVLHRKPQYNEFLKGSRNDKKTDSNNDKTNDNNEYDQYLYQGQRSKFVIPNKIFLTPYVFEYDEYSDKANYNETINHK